MSSTLLHITLCSFVSVYPLPCHDYGFQSFVTLSLRYWHDPTVANEAYHHVLVLAVEPPFSYVRDPKFDGVLKEERVLFCTIGLS